MKIVTRECHRSMGCTPSMLFDHKKGHRDSTGSQDQVLGGKGGACEAGSPLASVRVDAPRIAPRASMDSDGFSIQLCPKKDSLVSTMGNYSTTLHIKRISDTQSINSGNSGGSPGARLGHRKSSLALTPEDEPLDVSNRNSAGGAGGAVVVPQQDPIKVLAVMFPNQDRVLNGVLEGGSRVQMESTIARADEALDACQQRNPDLIVVDTRTSRIDGENLCRALRNLRCTSFAVIVAVVKKSHYVKEDFSIVPFLDAGFNRVVVESSSSSVWARELLQLWRGVGKPVAQAGVAKAVFAAVQRCRDVVHITDDNFRIQYVNKAGERLLGIRCEEANGKSMGDPGAEALSQLTRGRDWEGPMPLRRRAPSDTVTYPCKASPVSCDNRNTTHYVFVSDPTGTGGVSWDMARGSLHSVRRGSLDVRSVGSDGLRRASLAKLQGLPLEAPITKVITLLSSAQEGATPQTVALIDRAVDVLRTTELYSPHMRESYHLKTDDPVANDLIGALLTQGPTTVLSSRRSSNDSTVIKAQTSRQNVKHKAPVQLRELLETSLHWDFDIFRLEELTKKRPLVHLGFNLMAVFDGCATLECEERTMLNWLTVIEMNYHASNTYHNSTHAADVMQAVACYMRKDQLQELLDPLDKVAALIAAAAHDVDHPGTSSAFLCNSRHQLAILYNDLAVLESHHAALTFKLTLNDDRVNIFKNLDRETYKIARHTVIDMILATEMTKHFEHLAKFVNVFCPKTNTGSKEEMISNEPEVQILDTTENVTLVKRMMIKCADVSNPSRSNKFCVEWARRIAEEYFLQTDEEKARELPVVMPVFDRATCSIPRSQIGFIDFIIIHMVEAWDAFIDMPELLSHTKMNYQYWRDMDEKGVNTLQDVKRMQVSLAAPSLSIPKSSPE